MPKGNEGQTCGEAIRKVLQSRDPMAASEIFRQVKGLGSWKDETIWQHLMSLVVNLPPARHHWKTTPFLFVRPDGRYELFDIAKHPTPIN